MIPEVTDPASPSSQSEPKPAPLDSAAQLATRMSRVLAQKCPSTLSQDIDDLVQVALVRLLELQERRRIELTFSTRYLQLVARSVIIDEIRRRTQRPLLHFDAHWDVEMDPRPSTEEQVRGQQTLGTIAECMSKMGGDRRAALQFYLEGGSVRDCSRTFGWSYKRAENLVYRARSELQHRLRERGVRYPFIRIRTRPQRQPSPSTAPLSESDARSDERKPRAVARAGARTG